MKLLVLDLKYLILLFFVNILHHIQLHMFKKHPGVKRGKGRQNADGKGRRDEEVASSEKETELKTRVQNSIPYL